MSTVEINGSSLGNALNDLLTASEIEPGAEPSYQLCKTIYLYHPLGGKMAESPIAMAQSQQRIISVPNSPEERVVEQYLQQWARDKCDERIFNLATLARVYGIASLAVVTDQVKPSEPIDPRKLADLDIAFSVFDPLNTAGSLVLNQNPNATDFQKVTNIAVSGVPYHRSRTVTLMNERPIYLGYTTSAFGFVGRSVFQRALFPLKSFVQTMVTDDLVTKKSGVFVTKTEQAGSIIDNLMQKVTGLKRLVVRQAMNGNVISVGKDEDVETLNMQNIDGAFGNSRKNILENIAVSADMPAKILNSETFAEGFGEGTEDAKYVSRYIDKVRVDMQPAYEFMDRITMHRAWNKEFFAIIQNEFPDYRKKTYEQAFYEWSNSFAATWPSLLKEPPSEEVKVEKVKLEGMTDVATLLMPILDPENKANLAMWMQDNLNGMKLMFTNPMVLDFDALAAYVPPTPMAAGAGEEDEGAKERKDSNDKRKRLRNQSQDAMSGLFDERDLPKQLPPPRLVAAKGPL